MKTQKDFKLAVYGYGIELLLAVLLFACIQIYGKLDAIAGFLDATAGAWTTVFGFLLAGAMAARLIFFSLNTGDFSAWLEWRKVGGVITGVFLFNLLFFLIVTAVSIALINLKGTWLSKVAVLLFIYGIANAITFQVFVYRLIRLQAIFNLELRRAKEGF